MQYDLDNCNRIFDISRESCRNYVRGFRSKKKFIKDFPNDFDIVMAYHASNLNQKEQDSILKNGIILSTSKFMKEKAVTKFVHEQDNEDTKERIKLAIDEYFDEHVNAENKIFLTQLKNELLTISPQYLLYGSETLLTLATKMRETLRFNFRQRMIEHGDHCIITAHILTSTMSTYDIGTIYEHLKKGFIECCLVSKENIPPERIMKIEKFPRPVNIFE